MTTKSDADNAKRMLIEKIEEKLQERIADHDGLWSDGNVFHVMLLEKAWQTATDPAILKAVAKRPRDQAGLSLRRGCQQSAFPNRNRIWRAGRPAGSHAPSRRKRGRLPLLTTPSWASASSVCRLF